MLSKSQSVKVHRPSRGRGVPSALLVAVGLAAAWMGADAAGPLYRWTDENGVTVYSQRPPPGIEATRLTPDSGPSPEESERAEQRVRSLLEQDYDRREEAKRQEQESAEQADQQARRRANCEAARSNLANLENPLIDRVRTPDGEVQALSEEVRARYLEEARKAIQANCD